MGNAFLEEMRKTIEINDTPFDPEEMANDVVHPVTKETITKYKQLIADPVTRDVWSKAMCKELARLTQGYGETGSTLAKQALLMTAKPSMYIVKVIPLCCS